MGEEKTRTQSSALFVVAGDHRSGGAWVVRGEPRRSAGAGRPPAAAHGGARRAGGRVVRSRADAGRNRDRPAGCRGQPGAPPQPATANRALAAAWIAQQVGSDVNVSCDPQMCGEVREQGFPAARLTALPPRTDGPLGAGVVRGRDTDAAGPVRRPAWPPSTHPWCWRVSAREPTRLTSASSRRTEQRRFGPSSRRRIPTWSPRARSCCGTATSRPRRSRAPRCWPARSTPRLLVTLSALASAMPLRLVTFGDSSPGAMQRRRSLRGADIGAASPAGLSAVLSFLRAQQAPYLPAWPPSPARSQRPARGHRPVRRPRSAGVGGS